MYPTLFKISLQISWIFFQEIWENAEEKMDLFAIYFLKWLLKKDPK